MLKTLKLKKKKNNYRIMVNWDTTGLEHIVPFAPNMRNFMQIHGHLGSSLDIFLQQLQQV